MTHVHGDIRCINLPKVTAKEVGNMVTSVMGDHQREIFQQDLGVDFSFELPSVACFRVNVFISNHGPTAVFHTIPSTALALEDLRAPRIFQKIADSPRRLVLATGPTSSGRSTMLAATISCVDEAQPVHILTIEDPVEFMHLSKKALINQRELHQHTRGLANALRSALREDPDMILVGEMRNPETIDLALTATETDHLVFGTLHTAGAAKAIDRIVDVFPAGEREMVRSMLSESLRAVISQTLLKTRDGNDRVVTHEILISTPAVRNLTRENKITRVNSTLQTGQTHDMQTLDQVLQTLVHRGTISPEATRGKAQNSESLSIT